MHEPPDAAACHYAVAGDDQRDAIRAAGAAHRARRRAQPARDVHVAERPPAGNVVDGAPHPALEVGAAVGERQVEAETGIVEVALDLPADALGEASERGERRGAARQVVDAAQAVAGGAYPQHGEGCRQARGMAIQ